MTEVTKVKVIPISWEGSLHYDDIESLDEKCIYLVYDFAYDSHIPLYVGMSLDSLCEIYTGEIGTLSIYRGRLCGAKNISVSDAEKDMEEAKNLLINVLEYPAAVHRTRSVSTDMIQLSNIDLPELLSPFVKSIYYWTDGLAYDIVREIGKRFDQESICRGTFYGFYLYPNIYFGANYDMQDSDNTIPVIRIHKSDIEISTKESIENYLNIKLLSCHDHYCIPLGGITRENMNTMMPGLVSIIKKISNILEKSGVLHIPEFLRKQI